MKKIVLVLALLIIASAAQSATTIEIDNEGDYRQLQIFVDSAPADIGVFAYACFSEGWNEAYTGLEYSPIPEVQVGFGVGSETGGSRTGGWIWAGKDRVSVLYLFEDGATGPWHRLVAKYAASPSISLGYTEKSYSGGGVYADVAIGKGATLKYSGFKTPELGLEFKF